MVDLAGFLVARDGEGRLRLFGEKHADTLKAMGKLATTIGAYGDLARARAMQQRIVELAPDVWGEDGRDTWRALNNLAGTVAVEVLAAEGIRRRTRRG